VADFDWGVTGVLAVAVFFLAWYYAAFVYSRRLARRVATELKDAVLSLGGTSSVRWFGTTAFRMTTEEANPPFRQVSVTVTLRPREMPINWAVGTAQRRRDAALIEASLRANPRVAFELIDPSTRIGRRRTRAKSDWVTLSLDSREFLLSAEDDTAARHLIERLGAETLKPIMALNVTAGSESGIATSVSVEPGDAGRGLAAIRSLAERLVG